MTTDRGKRTVIMRQGFRVSVDETSPFFLQILFYLDNLCINYCVVYIMLMDENGFFELLTFKIYDK